MAGDTGAPAAVDYVRECEASGCEDAAVDVAAAVESLSAEVSDLLPAGTVVVDAHTHLGRDEDGQALEPAELLAALDAVGPNARACTFPLHDPERTPAYRLPNDRVLRWASESGGRLYPYCRLDPAEDPVAEAERCLTLGARGIKLHPRAQAFGFGNGAAESIWKVAEQAKVPILIHAGRGMPPMDSLADLALRYPTVTLVLAHAAIADQGMFAARLRDHPNVVYDTSAFSVFDQLELMARVPVERIVFASDIPYGRPIGALHTALRVAMYAGLDEHERDLLAGATMTAILEGRPLEQPTAPRVAEIRAISGRLARIVGYVTMAFGAAAGSGPPPDFKRGLQFISLARAVCRDPEPGVVGPALERIDGLLLAAEERLVEGNDRGRSAIGLVMAVAAIAATEPLGVSGGAAAD
jgi:hypothetical protein